VLSDRQKPRIIAHAHHQGKPFFIAPKNGRHAGNLLAFAADGCIITCAPAMRAGDLPDMAGILKLGVNIDHVATLREARGTDYPDVLEAAAACEKAGAAGITVHLREDRRHIRDADVYALRRSVRTRLNLEMADSPEIAGIALDALPDEVCIVPERRREVTTEGGLNVVGRRGGLAKTVRRLSDAGICVSLFIEPDPDQVRAAKDVGAAYVELHTGAYCLKSGRPAAAEVRRLVKAAELGHSLGLGINAGHGLNTDNVAGIFCVPHMDTLNIGHSIVARSVIVGLGNAVREMLAKMSAYNGGKRSSR
jgi:pyridoxine 5-phosphate synthase